MTDRGIGTPTKFMYASNKKRIKIAVLAFHRNFISIKINFKGKKKRITAIKYENTTVKTHPKIV